MSLRFRAARAYLVELQSRVLCNETAPENRDHTVDAPKGPAVGRETSDTFCAESNALPRFGGDVGYSGEAVQTGRAACCVEQEWRGAWLEEFSTAVEPHARADITEQSHWPAKAASDEAARRGRAAGRDSHVHLPAQGGFF